MCIPHLSSMFFDWPLLKVTCGKWTLPIQPATPQRCRNHQTELPEVTSRHVILPQPWTSPRLSPEKSTPISAFPSRVFYAPGTVIGPEGTVKSESRLVSVLKKSYRLMGEAFQSYENSVYEDAMAGGTMMR